MAQPDGDQRGINPMPEQLPTQAAIGERLRRGRVAFPPLALQWREGNSPHARGPSAAGALRVVWRRRGFRFTPLCRRLGTRKALAEAIEEARSGAGVARMPSLLIVPYLNAESLAALEEAGISGIDLCGNGIIEVPGQLYVRRSGEPNPFRAVGVIKNVYRDISSLVARVFLARPEYGSLRAVLEEIERRGGAISLPTVSKVARVLEEELIVARSTAGRAQFRLVQPEKLLDRLANHYRPASITRRWSGKFRGDEANLRDCLRAWSRGRNRVVQTGASSATAYAVMARSDPTAFYCDDLSSLLAFLEDRVEPNSRFPNLTLLETNDNTVYFDRRLDYVASGAQTYLELSAGDKRERETAAQVRAAILAGLA